MGALNFQPNWQALTPATRQAFEMLKQLDSLPQYYLAGGTGLAIHLGHRISVDLDMFSDNPQAANVAERATLRQIFADESLSIVYDKDSTFVANWRGVGISFFRLQTYPLVSPTIFVDGVSLASIEEIGAMKLAAIIGRGTRKDMVDLYYILQQVDLETIFQVAAIKYAQVNSFPTSAVRALAYFDEAEAIPMPRMLDKTPWPKMKKFLQAQAITAGKKHLEDLWHS